MDFATGLSIRKLPSIDPNGCVVVTQVDRDSAAWAAGLRVGTMISKLNGKRIASPTEFHKVASNLPGLVKVSVYDRFRLQVVDVPE